jgi:hypothetical protein
LEENPISKNIPPLKETTLLPSIELLKAILEQYWFIGASMYRRSSVLAVWDVASQDKYVVDYSLAIYLAINGNQGMYINTLDFFASWHPGQIGQSKKDEALYQTQQALERIVTEPQALQYARLIHRTRSNLKIIQARSLDLTLKNSRIDALRLIANSLRIDCLNIWSWKQFSKLLVFGKL